MKRGSMQCKIPEDMRAQLAEDPFVRRCIIDDDFCDGRLEWNHGLSYAGRRINELYSLIPMCHTHHGKEASLRPQIDAAIRARIKDVGMEHSSKEKYPKSSLLNVHA